MFPNVHFGETHDHGYSRENDLVVSQSGTNVSYFRRGADFLQFPKVEFGKRPLRWNQLLSVAGRGDEEGEVYLRSSREAWLHECFI